ncbi:zinc-ribbon domain-containing protein [Microbacterium sp. CCH5-D1]|uniref:zinc-ribbon domain-containing protein n=1 Tax=Microbacterium sp. CCH5-D1 TaxID=1768780 RepID=UPI003FA5D8C8
MVSITSSERIGFACREGHRVAVPAANRRNTFLSRFSGCGVCSGRRVLRGYNSLADTHPRVAERWHPTRNGVVTPGDVKAGSSTSRWWLCRNGHAFEASPVNMRRKDGRSCRYCTRQAVEVGVTSLDVTHPQVAQRWHPTMNGGLSAAHVLSGSPQVVWWLCDAGHPYDLSIVLAASGIGCGVCRGMRAVPGVNTLQDRYPEIAAQWHPYRNGGLTPSSVTSGSGKEVWWLCESGHAWPAPVFRRKTRGCRVCANLEARMGVNSLVDTHPQLAAEWHPTYNAGVVPGAVVAGSPKKYWWRCPAGHPYEQALVRRRDGQGCYYCSNRRVWSGFNDARTRFPDLLKDWDCGRNREFNPSNRLPGGKKHYWRCRRSGHLAYSTIPNRRLTNGCPQCDPSDRVGLGALRS